MIRAARSGRRLATVLTSTGLAALIASSTVLASTPVTEGYRDHAYGGGVFRPAGDKPQSKLWYADGSWWGGMFLWQVAPSTPKSENRIYRYDAPTHSFVLTPTIVDTRDMSHADYLWDAGSQTLYVASIPTIPGSVPTSAVDDGMKVFKYTYSAGVYSPVAGFPKSIANTASVPSVSAGGAATATIALDSTGDLWVVWPKDTQVRYSRSTDDGVTWSEPAQVPAQAANPIRAGNNLTTDSAAVVAFGSDVGIMWSDHDALPDAAEDGFYFATIAAGADPTVGGNWTLEELPTLVSGGALAREVADNHVNVKATSDGSVYMVGKTGKDTANCATNKQLPLIEFFERTPGAGGTWSVHLVGTAGDCNTRPQLVISEQLDTAYVFLTAPNGGGTVYRKSAPLNGPDAFDFRGAADQTLQPGTPFIRSSTETQIDDPSTTKQSVTSASGIVVIASNLTTSRKFYLHNDMAIAASDAAAPSGSVSINGGAASTSSQSVTVAVPATDAGSGVSLVKLSNNSDMSSSSTFVYTTPIAWTLSAGFGTKTVYVQWRDAAGNWSSPAASDTIEFTDDVTAPNPPGPVAHTIFGSGRFGIPVRLTWTAGTDNTGGSGVQGYRVTKSVNGGAFTEVTPMTTALGISLDLPNSAITYRFCVYTIDNRDNVSGPRCSATFTTRSYSESNANIRYSGTWTLSSSTVYVGGKARVSSARNSSASLGFRGNRVGWYSRLGPAYGQARVYIDGVLVKTVNLFAATNFDRKLVYTRSWTTVGTHSIRIVVVGTSGHPKVVLDQIFVLQ